MKIPSNQPNASRSCHFLLLTKSHSYANKKWQFILIIHSMRIYLMFMQRSCTGQLLCMLSFCRFVKNLLTWWQQHSLFASSSALRWHSVGIFNLSSNSILLHANAICGVWTFCFRSIRSGRPFDGQFLLAALGGPIYYKCAHFYAYNHKLPMYQHWIYVRVRSFFARLLSKQFTVGIADVKFDRKWLAYFIDWLIFSLLSREIENKKKKKGN